MKKIFVLLFILFIANNVCAGEKESLIKKGLELSYNFQIKESEKIYNTVIETYPNEPEGYLYMSQNHLWTYLGNKDEGDYEVFFKYLNLGIERLNNKLNKAEKKYEINYLLGKAYMFKAMALSTAEKKP